VLVPGRSPRGVVRAWLAVHAAYHLEPAGALSRLARSADPEVVLAGVDAPVPEALLDDRIDRLARLGTVLLPWPAAGYPERLRSLPDAAPLLLVRGEPGALLGRAVAVVGARAPTVYGIEVARRLASALARAGVVVVSGLARGIDSVAHRAALDAGGLTVAFSACGPDRVYPAEHALLADEIAAAGAVVTEMPPGTPPLPGYFPLRNRLIAGLAEIVVVVEGRPRSGSLVTARRALDQGREVMAVPGPIDAPTSQGPNELLRDGARPVTDVADVFEELGLEPPGDRTRSGDRDWQTGDAGTGELARRVLGSLRRAPCTRDALGRRLGVAPGLLSVALTELELAGRLFTDRDGRLRVVGPA